LDHGVGPFQPLNDPSHHLGIVREHERSRYPEPFCNREIDVAWAGLTHRVDRTAVPGCCAGHEMLDSNGTSARWGWTRRRELSVVITLRIGDTRQRRIICLVVHRDFSEVDDLMKRFEVAVCVIDALPETHASRVFPQRHRGLALRL